MGNKIDREARNQWETELIARFVMVAKLRQIQVRLTTIRDQGQRTTKIAIGEQRLTTIRDQGQKTTQIAIGKQRSLDSSSYSACTNVSLPFGNLIFVWLFGNFNPVGPAATPLRPASRPATVTLIAARARVRRQRPGTQCQ
jgi:hypothetical protein